MNRNQYSRLEPPISEFKLHIRGKLLSTKMSKKNLVNILNEQTQQQLSKFKYSIIYDIAIELKEKTANSIQS